MIASFYHLYYHEKQKSHRNLSWYIKEILKRDFGMKKISRNLLNYCDGGEGVGWLYTNDGACNFNLLALDMFSISLLTEKRLYHYLKRQNKNKIMHVVKNIGI